MSNPFAPNHHQNGLPILASSDYIATIPAYTLELAQKINAKLASLSNNSPSVSDSGWQKLARTDMQYVRSLSDAADPKYRKQEALVSIRGGFGLHPKQTPSGEEIRIFQDAPSWLRPAQDTTAIAHSTNGLAVASVTLTTEGALSLNLNPDEDITNKPSRTYKIYYQLLYFLG